MSAFVKVAARSDIDEGQLMAVEANGAEVVLACVAGEIFAVDAICSHALGYLDQGWLEGCTVVCPLHAGSFDLRTGAPVAAPASAPIRTYAVKIEGDAILVDTSSSS